jgi:cytochrome c-type biogenesis protein CcmF
MDGSPGPAGVYVWARPVPGRGICMSPGGIVLKAAAFFIAVSFVLAVGWARGRRDWERWFRLAYGATAICLGLSVVLLVRAILGHDFRYDYVIGYSSRDLAKVYLISAFWGGQEGTYLLWALFAILLGFILSRKRAWNAAAVMAGYTGSVGLLLVFMMNRNGDPFRLASVVPPDGRGLNPLLQDPWMASHPPIVFLGYAVLTVPGILAWVAAWKRDDAGWVTPALRWALAGFLTLGVGIIMGAVWAYKVLGWGGFWGWDPVENASLIPWIVSAALIHGLLVQGATGALRTTNLILGSAAYVLVLYATFLTRSGVLADFSVHSFPAGSIYGWLVGALVAVIAVPVISLWRRKARAGAPMETRLAWPVVLTITIVIFAISAGLVLLGTSWPIVSSAFGKPSTPNATFYNQVNLPLYVVLLFALGLGPFLAWAPLPRAAWLRRLVISAAIAVVGTGVAVAAGGHGAGPIALFFGAILALVSNVVRLVEVARRRLLHTGAAVAHLGFGLMFIGIVAGEVWDKKVDVRLPQNEPATAFGRTLTYTGFIEGSQPKERWAVKVEEPGGAVVNAELTMYTLDNGQSFKKPAILRRAAGDLYISPITLEDGGAGSGESVSLKKGEPLSFSGATLTLLGYEMGGEMGAGGMSVTAKVLVDRGGQADTVALPMAVGENGMVGEPVPVPALDGRTLTFQRMSVEERMVELAVGHGEPVTKQPEVLLVEASLKPFLWVLWVGTTLLTLGSLIALARRAVERSAPAAAGIPVRRPAAREVASTGGSN